MGKQYTLRLSTGCCSPDMWLYWSRHDKALGKARWCESQRIGGLLPSRETCILSCCLEIQACHKELCGEGWHNRKQSSRQGNGLRMLKIDPSYYFRWRLVLVVVLDRNLSQIAGITLGVLTDLLREKAINTFTF
mmetsp:Transcript_60600/g.123662  ORF Transcript_60600/g.123662 Transcript_60600/m.123662 type:complete len:134 (-) Transcript_60600:1005-1406(-)